MSRPLQVLLRSRIATTARRVSILFSHRPFLANKNSRNSNLRLMAIQRREQSGLSSLSNYLKDVVRSKSLNPKNPVLIGVLQQSLISDDGNAENEDRPLPQFSHMLPYHLENAVSEVMRQYKVDLAELEVAITNHIVVEPTDVVDRIDRLEASVVQLLQVGQLFTDLASPPDQVEEWQASHAKSQHMLHTLSWRRSKLLYQALLKNDNNVTRPLRLAFEKQGAHLLIGNDPEHDKQEELAGLQSLDQELQSLKERLAKQQRRGTFNEAPKQTRLQMVSDMYNLVGLSQVQSQQLGFPNVMSMEATYNHHMATIPDELFKIHHQVTEFLKPHLPKPKLTLDEEAGAFLGTRSNREGPTEDKKELWRAKQSVKNLLYLHGVLDGISEFCEAMFGIRMEVVKDGSNGGWNKNVQLIHLYETTTKSDDDHNEKDSDGGKQQKLLGTVYLEPFRDPYWRSESAQELVTTRLFSQRRFQTAVPVAIVALAVAPAWDDVPTPLTWEDTRDLLFQFGKAIQLILANQPQSTVSAPVDVSEFMATFMELWVQNDGFLQRLAQLSQDQFTFQPELIEILRRDLQKKKAAEIMHNVFLATLELTVFTDFDPRGEETLAALQKRLAEQYIPYNVPDSSDLSHLLETLLGVGGAEEGDHPNGVVRTPAYGSVYSEVLAALIYEKFQNTDLRNREEAKRLGQGIRDLFYLRETSLTKNDIEHLCGKKISPEALKQVYKF